MEQGHPGQQRHRSRHHRRVVGVELQHLRAGGKHCTADQQCEHQRELHAVPAQATRIAQVARADALRDQGAGGIAQTHRQHEQQRHQVGRDLVARNRGFPQARDEDRHERKSRHFDQDRHPDRQTQSQQRAQRAQVQRSLAGCGQFEAVVERVAPQHQPSDQGLHPHRDHRRQAAAQHVQRRDAQGRHPRDQGHRQRDLERQTADLQRHHRLGPRHRDIESPVDREQQRGRQCESQRQQVATHFLRHRRAGLRQGQERCRKRQQRATDQAQCQRQPERLPRLVADLAQPLGAEQLADDRADGEHDAHQADEHRDVAGAADCQRGQVCGRTPCHQHGVNRAEAQHGDLTDEYRPGQRHDAAHAGAQASHHLGLSADTDRVGLTQAAPLRVSRARSA